MKNTEFKKLETLEITGKNDDFTPSQLKKSGYNKKMNNFQQLFISI